MTFLYPSKFSISLKMTMLSLLMTSLLAGCGIRGTLKTPPPVFGSASKADPKRVPTEDLDKQNEDEDEEEDEDDLGNLDHDPLSDF